MKKSLLILSAFIVSALGTKAQITITMADIASPVTVIQQATDTMPTIAVGAAGISQTWNFAALNTHSTDTLNFISPGWAPQAAQFPGSNLAVEFSGQNAYAYASNTSSAMTVMGSSTVMDFGAGPSNLIPKNTPAEILTNYPATYLSNFVNNYTTNLTYFFGVDPGFGFVVDSIRQKTMVTKTSNVDAWGTISTPLMSTVPCIRFNVTKNSVDSLWAYITSLGGWNFIQETVSDSREFSWWANGIGFPLVDASTNMAADTVWQVQWLKAAPTAGINDYSSKTDVNVYPNPAQNDITFALSASKVNAIQVLDITGRLIETYSVSSDNVKINISTFANGIYTYSIIGKDNSILNRGKFTVAK